MKIADLAPAQLASSLKCGSLVLDTHPFTTRLRSDIPLLTAELARLYAGFELFPDDRFADFHIEVRSERSLFGGLKPQARFHYDGKPSFLPLPRRHALPMFEWGLNWCVASHAHEFLVIHAAALERGGRALLLPAPPGSGKSTLTAGLTSSGWRLLSDELALIEPASGLVRGMARPVNLKNRSIDVVQAFEPATVMSTPVPDTAKGLVALMAAPPDSVARRREPARPAWVVLPRYKPGATPRFTRVDRARCLLLMAEQSFNYDVHGATGFELLANVLSDCQCMEFEYSRLEDARDAFADLT